MRVRYTFSLLLATLILSFSLAVSSPRADILPILHPGIIAASSVLKVTKTGPGEGIVASYPEDISCGEDCSGVYPTNTKVTLTATGIVGKGSFDSWGGACTGITPTCKVTVAGITEVTAKFVESRTLVREDGIWWGLHNGGRPTFYYVHLMQHYPPTFTLVMDGCETVVVKNDGHRFESSKLIAKQSDVGGRGLAVTTQAGVCGSSRTSHILYYKEDMPVENPPIYIP